MPILTSGRRHATLLTMAPEEDIRVQQASYVTESGNGRTGNVWLLNDTGKNSPYGAASSGTRRPY